MIRRTAGTFIARFVSLNQPSRAAAADARQSAPMKPSTIAGIPKFSCFSGIARDDDKSSASPDPSTSPLAASMQWRKSQLGKIEDKFRGTSDGDTVPSENGEELEEEEGYDEKREIEVDLSIPGPLQIDSDDDLQQMWRDMESRVTKRRSLTAAQRGSKVGRQNIRRTEEDIWLESGLYGIDADDSDVKSNKGGEEE